MAPSAEHFNINNLRMLVRNPLETLESIGEFWRAMPDGVIYGHVKLLLEILSPEQRRAYFCESGRGAKLLSKICFTGNLSEVRYAFETLRLHETVPISRGYADHTTMCPLSSTLSSQNPSLAVIRYVISRGYPVRRKEYFLWAACQAGKEQLKAILKVLVEHGRQFMPPIRSLFPVMSNPSAMLSTWTFVDRYSTHLDLLRSEVTITTEDIYDAARLGFGRILEQLTDGDDTIDQDTLADLYEYCEFAAYRRSKEFPTELRYFRKSLEIRQNPESRRRISFGSRVQFTSIEDLERIEKQMQNNDHVECNWQMFLAAASAVAMKSDVSFNAMKGIVTLDQVAEVKSFVTSSGRFEGDEWSFIDSLRERCEHIVQATMLPEITMLPKLYDCLKEIFVEGDEPLTTSLVDTIVMLLIRASACPDILSQLDIVKEWRDEMIFLMAYSLRASNQHRSAEMTIELVAPFITRLLNMGAGLGILPGHTKSTLRLILSSKIDLEPAFKDVLRNHACCHLDLLPSQQRSLGLPEKVKSPLSLKCIAAAQCSKLPRTILKKHLPGCLVGTAAGHPHVNNSENTFELPPLAQQLEGIEIARMVE